MTTHLFEIFQDQLNMTTDLFEIENSTTLHSFCVLKLKILPPSIPLVSYFIHIVDKKTSQRQTTINITLKKC